MLISLTTILLFLFVAVLAVVAGWGIVKAVQKEAPLLAARRKAAGILSQAFKVAGLTKLPEALLDYSTGDYAGFFDKLHDFANLVKNGNDAILKEFDSIFVNLLTAKLSTSDGRALVTALLLNASGPADPTSPPAAPSPAKS